MQHEEAHRDHFYLPAFSFWPASMQTFAANVAAASVPFVPGTAARSSQAAASLRGTWDSDVANQHGIADAAEIGGSETFAHGVSNPLYLTLVNAIRTTVLPPAPRGLAAASTTPTSSTLTWTAADARIVNAIDIERRTAGGAWTPVAAGLPPGTVTLTDSSLTRATRYEYRAVAVGTAGRSTGVTIRVRTTP
jgi:hypothetical protein